MIRVLALVLACLVTISGADAQGWRDRYDGGGGGGYRGGGGGGRGGTPGDFDFYVLALSWSPTFCMSEAGQRNRTQCDRNARSEFVVHGLWPQYNRGFPESCGAFNRPIPRNAMEKAAAIFPDAGLARYEWNKHGTCSGLGPSDYFDAVADARSRVTVPAQMHGPKAPLQMTPADIERAFVGVNKGLRADMMSVQCKRNQLTEIRICFSKDLKGFVTCPDVNRSSCRISPLTIPVAY